MRPHHHHGAKPPGLSPLEIFRMIAPEFKDIPDEDVICGLTGEVKERGVQTFLELYKDQISPKRFGATYPKALAYLCAHKLKMAGMGDDTGIGSIADALRVASVSEGETSVSFSTNQRTNMEVDGEYALTIYGLEFLNLRRNAIIPIISAGESHIWD